MKNIIHWLKRYRQNLLKQKSNEAESLKLLSNTKEWQELAAFWGVNASAIHTVAAVKLLEYIQSNSVTQKEIDAFKEGLAILPLYLEQCHKDVEATRKGEMLVESR